MIDGRSEIGDVSEPGEPVFLSLLCPDVVAEHGLGVL